MQTTQRGVADSDNEAVADREELVTLLAHQRTLYRRLGMLAERQRALIGQEDTNPLLGLLAERQTLVDGLTGLNQRLAPFRERWTEIYRGLDETSRRAVTAMLDEANASLGKILQADGRDCQTLAARREVMSQQLSRGSEVGVARGAYVAERRSAAVVGQLADAEA